MVQSDTRALPTLELSGGSSISPTCAFDAAWCTAAENGTPSSASPYIYVKAFYHCLLYLSVYLEKNLLQLLQLLNTVSQLSNMHITTGN